MQPETIPLCVAAGAGAEGQIEIDDRIEEVGAPAQPGFVVNDGTYFVDDAMCVEDNVDPVETFAEDDDKGVEKLADEDVGRVEMFAAEETLVTDEDASVNVCVLVRVITTLVTLLDVDPSVYVIVVLKVNVVVVVLDLGLSSDSDLVVVVKLVSGVKVDTKVCELDLAESVGVAEVAEVAVSRQMPCCSNTLTQRSEPAGLTLCSKVYRNSNLSRMRPHLWSVVCVSNRALRTLNPRSFASIMLGQQPLGRYFRM